jgi:hypothetical protein
VKVVVSGTREKDEMTGGAFVVVGVAVDRDMMMARAFFAPRTRHAGLELLDAKWELSAPLGLR